MSWRLFFRALWLRGGIVWLVATHHRVLPRRLPGPWFLSRWATRLNSKRQGGKDGKLGQPTAQRMSGPDPDFPAHLMYLKNRGDAFVRAVLEAMVKLDNKKGGRSAAISHVRQLINHATDQRTRLNDFERRFELSRGDLERREGELNENQEALAAAKKRRRSVELWSRGLPRVGYSALLFALAVAELPLLALAFQNFFSVGFSVIVSLGVSVAIIFCAHVAGMLLNKRETVLLPADTAILTAIWVGVLSTIVGLSFVRELYLKTNGQAEGVSTGPTWGVVVVFAIFNVMVFGAAVLVSKFRHSEYAETVDDARRAVRGTRREIRRARRREKRARRQVSRMQDRIVLLEGLASSTAQRARTSVDQARLAAAGRKDFIETCFALYVRENTRAQAYWAARKARLRRPLESSPIPLFNRLPEVKDPDVEFRPFQDRVDRDLRPLEELLTHVESLTQTLEERAIDAAMNGAPATAASDGASASASDAAPADAV
jgi:hypothetical protein